MEVRFAVPRRTDRKARRAGLLIPGVKLPARLFLVLGLCMTLGACSGRHGADDDAGHDHESSEEHVKPTALTNRIDIPEQVRRNLGITFAKVEMRKMASVLRLPGRFELIPSGRREYHAPLAGKIELLVQQYDTVSTGALLYRLDSAEWRKLQQEIAEAKAQVGETSASFVLAQLAQRGGTAASTVILQRLAAGERHIENLKQSVSTAQARLTQLEKLHATVGGKLLDVNEARAKLAESKTALSQAEEEKADLQRESLRQTTEQGTAFTAQASLVATLESRRSDYEAALMRLKVARESAASVLGVEEHELDKPTGGLPLWQSVSRIEFAASAPGIVQSVAITNGAYVDATGLVLTIADPSMVRFRAVALQSDLEKLEDGLAVRILPPAKGTDEHDHKPLVGSLKLAQEADPNQRSLDAIITPVETDHWARPGVATQAEVILDESEEPLPAIPVAAIVQDDLHKVLFRRDPKDPDKAIRLEADLGLSDGEWIAVESGVKAGDEVVLGGVYQLKLAGGGKATQTGHFHADGAFHDGEH